jgi:hypothetical protein
MSGPLDDLREKFLTSSTMDPQTIHWAIKYLDTFEAAHPGLVDLTGKTCDTCESSEHGHYCLLLGIPTRDDFFCRNWITP